MKKAKALMIQGTGSGAGKSLLVAALCRIFSNKGIRVAPFKAQNMALNSYITADGGEIGRAQALQAEAARVMPTVDMNPILLKASGQMGSQVIIHGRVHSQMKAQEYYAFRKEAWKAVRASFGRLSQEQDLIVIEGAGSPAEINLMDVDIVNMSVAKHAKAPVILVGDIDKGGVFASLYGTVKLLGRDSRQIKAFVINKFRGDPSILRPGLDMIREMTGKPVIGVIPYLSHLGLPEEDGLALGSYKRIDTNYGPSHGRKSSAPHARSARRRGRSAGSTVKVVVVRLQYISNFTDYDPFLYEPDVELVYSQNPSDIENADMVIIPGSKNTIKDLLFLRENRLDESIRNAHAKGIQVVGICGGYQMLGTRLSDPCGIDSPCKQISGIGLLRISTVFGQEKTTTQAEGAWTDRARTDMARVFSLPQSTFDHPVKGYEIHMGISKGDIGLFRLKRLAHAGQVSGDGRDPEEFVPDGSMNGNCWGTYLHGIFDNDVFRTALINQIRARKGMSVAAYKVKYADVKEGSLDRLAAAVAVHIDLGFLQREVALW